jgi:chromosome segregation ATPase
MTDDAAVALPVEDVAGAPPAISTTLEDIRPALEARIKQLDEAIRIARDGRKDLNERIATAKAELVDVRRTLAAITPRKRRPQGGGG